MWIPQFWLCPLNPFSGKQVWDCRDSPITVVAISCHQSLSLPSYLEGFGTNLIRRSSNWKGTLILPLSLPFAATLNCFSQCHVSHKSVSQVQGRPNCCSTRRGIHFTLRTWQHHTSIWSPWHNNDNATLWMTAPPCAMHSNFISWAITHDQGCLLIFSQGGIIRSYPDVFITFIHRKYCPHHSQHWFCADFCVCCLIFALFSLGYSMCTLGGTMDRDWLHGTRVNLYNLVFWMVFPWSISKSWYHKIQMWFDEQYC